MPSSLERWSSRSLAALVLLLWLCAPPQARADEPAAGSASARPICPASCQLEALPSEASKAVDLNRADEHELLDLPGIGPARARAILAFRQSHGAFRSISQLLQIKGIGRALLRQLRPLVTL